MKYLDGFRILDSRFMKIGYRILDFGFRNLDFWFLISDFWYLISDSDFDSDFEGLETPESLGS